MIVNLLLEISWNYMPFSFPFFLGVEFSFLVYAVDLKRSIRSESQVFFFFSFLVQPPLKFGYSGSQMDPELCL